MWRLSYFSTKLLMLQSNVHDTRIRRCYNFTTWWRCFVTNNQRRRQIFIIQHVTYQLIGNRHDAAAVFLVSTLCRQWSYTGAGIGSDRSWWWGRNVIALKTHLQKTFLHSLQTSTWMTFHNSNASCSRNFHVTTTIMYRLVTLHNHLDCYWQSIESSTYCAHYKSHYTNFQIAENGLIFYGTELWPLPVTQKKQKWEAACHRLSDDYLELYRRKKYDKNSKTQKKWEKIDLLVKKKDCEAKCTYCTEQTTGYWSKPCIGKCTITLNETQEGQEITGLTP